MRLSTSSFWAAVTSGVRREKKKEGGGGILAVPASYPCSGPSGIKRGTPKRDERREKGALGKKGKK